jgi:peptidoglycan/xylan/chitin deacetylase (PgdA/CDA1 family)
MMAGGQYAKMPLPILRRFSVVATHYVITGYLDDSQYPHYMNLERVSEVERAGHEIGCHTVSHRHLPRELESLVEAEVSLSKESLFDHGFRVTSFAYPYGEYEAAIDECWHHYRL